MLYFGSMAIFMTSVEPPIIEQCPIFFSFLNQMERFLCHWTCKFDCYKCAFNIKNKGAKQKTQEGPNFLSCTKILSQCHFF